MSHNFALDDKLVLNRLARTRKEVFGELVLAKGGPTLCLNEAAAHILALCDGHLSVRKVIDKIVTELDDYDDRHSLEVKIESVIDALYNANILMIKK